MFGVAKSSGSLALWGGGSNRALSALYGAGVPGQWQGEIAIDGRPTRLKSIVRCSQGGVGIRNRRPAWGRSHAAYVGRPQSGDVDHPPDISKRLAVCATPKRMRSKLLSANSTSNQRIPILAVGALSGEINRRWSSQNKCWAIRSLLLLDEADTRRRRSAQRGNCTPLAQTCFRGLGILVASSEMPELIGLCDRIVVLRNGCSVAGVFRRRRRTRSPGGRQREEGLMSEQQITSSPAIQPAKRIDPLAVMVRFQSLIGLILVFAGGIIFSPRRHGVILFLQPDNIANIVRAVSETGVIAIGMTFVIITAGIDLSVGATLGLASVVTATLMVSGGFGLIATVLAVLLMGICFGLVKERSQASFGLRHFIVTLAGSTGSSRTCTRCIGQSVHQYLLWRWPGLAPPSLPFWAVDYSAMWFPWPRSSF